MKTELRGTYLATSFFQIVIRAFALFTVIFSICARATAAPNVIIIVTDDQGFGELGVTGNPIVHTPHIDRFAKQSVSLANFHIMPVCSPTRASLMTGRDYYRTGLTDTWMGSSLMDPAEITLAQMFSAAGYRTGIFGKWHLGDNYPRRPEDKGFQESFVLNGGGLAQPGDPPDPVDERGAYFNATLRHNGSWVKTKGYIGDVVTDAAIHYIESNHTQPFLVYLAFNLPHAPHQVPDEYSKHFPANAFDATNFPRIGNPLPARHDADDLAHVYGMIENIDDNVGRLLAKLDELKLSDDTIVMLLSDNGCQQHNGYNAGLRGWKGSTWEGGIHQFCFVRWPKRLKAGERIDQIASIIDVAPTLLDFCAVKKPVAAKFDGLSLAPLLRGETNNWPDRNLFFQWHRGAAPERYRNFAVRSQNWKLVHSVGAFDATEFLAEQRNRKMDFQLFDMVNDPYEMHNVANEHWDRIVALKDAYDKWFDGITNAHDFSKPERIIVGVKQENPVLLTRQDWRGPNANWQPDGMGYWELDVAETAVFDIKLRFDPAKTDGEVILKSSGVAKHEPIKSGDEECDFKQVTLPAGQTRLETTIQENASVHGVKYVELKRVE